MKSQYKTNLEKLMYDELTRRGLIFEFQYPTRNGFIIDFAFPEIRLAIECDGARWHAPGNRKDKFRDRLLRKSGWLVIRFKEEQILEDISLCGQIVETEVNRITHL